MEWQIIGSRYLQALYTLQYQWQLNHAGITSCAVNVGGVNALIG